MKVRKARSGSAETPVSPIVNLEEAARQKAAAVVLGQLLALHRGEQGWNTALIRQNEVGASGRTVEHHVSPVAGDDLRAILVDQVETGPGKWSSWRVTICRSGNEQGAGYFMYGRSGSRDTIQTDRNDPFATLWVIPDGSELHEAIRIVPTDEQREAFLKVAG